LQRSEWAGLLKRFFTFWFASLLRDAVFLLSFFSISLSEGQREGLHVMGAIDVGCKFISK
jgi:hypothetical protein